VKARIIKATALNNTSSLPANPVLHSLITKKALDHLNPSHQDKAIPSKAAHAKLVQHKPALTTATSHRKLDQPDTTPVLQILTVLNNLVSKVEKLDSRLTALEQQPLPLTTQTNSPPMLSVIETSLMHLSQQLETLEKRVQKKIEQPSVTPSRFSLNSALEPPTSADSPNSSDSDFGTEQWSPEHPAQRTPVKEPIPSVVLSRSLKTQQHVTKYFAKGKAPADT